MNPSQEKMIAEMGIGPVWKLRSNSFGGMDAAQVVPPMNLPSESDRGPNSPENNTVCQTCGWCQIIFGEVQSAQSTDANYLFIHDCTVDSAPVQRSLESADQLLHSILRELRIKIGVNGYVSAIVKSKPVTAPGRQFTGLEGEMYVCLACLKKQIELIRPRVIISLGSGAAMSLLGLDASTALSALRGQLHRYGETPLVITHGLDYLLQKPKEKRGLWTDLCLAMSAT